MNGVIYANYSCLLFTILIAICFFCKKKVKSVETKLYGWLIIVSLLELVFGLLTSYLIFYDYGELLTIIFGKFYLIMILSWIFILTLYVINIRKDGDSFLSTKNLIRIVELLYLISCFLMIVLEIDFVKNENNSIFCKGIGLNILYVSAFIMIFIFLYLGVRNIKYHDKRFIPLWMFIIIGTIISIIQFFYPELFLLVPLEAFVTSIMYHTIENPDVRMIQQLEVAREQADKANRAKTDFLSSMSHEIRTPLNAIVGFSDCIMDANTLGEAKENAKDIVNASQTLLEIVNGILDISKIEAGKIEIVNSKYNAPDTFLELAKLITPKMNEKGLDFTYKIAPDLPQTLFGDHANLKKIVTNLLSNACKYTEKGFVHYEVNCINSGDVSKLVISVEDSGRGIKKESIDKMFTKFQRLDEDRNTTIEGTGLGLAITKQLIELMGGKIIVHTVYGEGSKFTVVLNQRIETGVSEEKKKVKTTLDLHNVRILLVDDTPLNLKVATKLLEKYNANHIITCNSGFECIDKIQRGEVYDIILLDDMMPKMSGVETLKKLKEIPGFKIPTVALTANAITGMREKYLADGFDDYLAKPIEKEQLIQVVNQILGRSVTEELTFTNVPILQTPAIRSEEIPNVEDYDRAEEERKKNSIIPVEDNIEEILGDQVERNYVEEQDSTLSSEESVEVSEDSKDPLEIDLVPVVDIDVATNNLEKVYDRKYLEDNGVDVEHALELLGDMDMYNMTISDFMSEVEAKWGRIVDYKNQNDMEDYAIEVHSLKSDCKYLGFMKLADISYQHELKSKEKDTAFVNYHFAELEEEYLKVLAIAREYVEHNPIK